VSLRPSEVALLAAELTRELDGAAVQKVSAPTATRVYLELRVPGRTETLLLCAEPGVARVSVVEERPANPPRPPGWQSVLRRELTGARLRDAEALPARRTILVHLDRPAEEAKSRRTLVLELGTEPVVALLNEAARVLALSSPAREGLKVGGTWTPLEERPVGEAASRLSGDHVHLRLAHAAEALFATVEQRRWSDARRAPVQAKLKRLERTREKVRGDLARTEKAGELKREGELLAQNLYRLTRGAASVTVPEYLEDGTTRDVTIALDPQRTPKAEVDFRFHQYRRLTRGAELVKKRLAALDAEEQALRAELARLDAAPAEAPTAEVLQRPRAAQAPLPPYREYVGHGGQRIWVGRGSVHNDALTFRVARPFHVWLHARGVPGAHVVVPLEKNAQLSSEALIDAAHLALHHSDLKGEPRGEVSYTAVKFVRKAKDAAPGAVTFTREKTVLVRVEPARLGRLLAQDETR
jgi:predicted ribosome quality control (RQC) complex YloA/Tae2 family protein